MNEVLRVLSICILSLAVAACVANPTRKEINAKDVSNVRSTQVVSIISQDEITAHVVNPNITAAAGGGLLVALIDASIVESRTNEAEGFIAPLREGLAQLDFRQEYWAREIELFNSPNWLQSKQPKNTALNMTVEQIRNTVSTMQEDAFLIMRTEYHLSSDFKRMVVQGYAQLWTKGQDLPTYAAKLEYQSAAVPAEDKAEAVNYWNKDGAKAALATLYEGMDEVINLLKIDLFKNKGVAISDSGEKISLPYANSVQTFSDSVDGVIIAENNGRYMIKANDGKLLSLVQDDNFKLPENKLSIVLSSKVTNTPVPVVAIKPVSPAEKQITSQPDVPGKPVVLVSWAEPGELGRYVSTSVDSYSHKLSGVMKRIIQQQSQADVEIILLNGSSVTHIAEQVSQREPSASLCKSKNARYVVTAITGLTDAEYHGTSSYSREIEYNFHDCSTSNHRKVTKIVSIGERDRFRFEQGYSDSFSNFIAASIFSTRKISQKTLVK